MQGQFPNRLAELLEQTGMKPHELAVRLGCHPKTVERWRSGSPIPDARKSEIAQIFDVSIPHLMGWDEQPAGTTA